jgi:hypothetical protein
MKHPFDTLDIAEVNRITGFVTLEITGRALCNVSKNLPKRSTEK